MKISSLVLLLVLAVAVVGYLRLRDGEPPVPETAAPEAVADPLVDLASPPAAAPPASATAPADTGERGSLAAAAGAETGELTPFQCEQALAERFPDPVDDRLASSNGLAELGRMLAPSQALLRGSADPEHRYAAAILEPLVDLPTEELVGLLESGRGTALLAWHGLRICMRLPEGACPNEARFAADLAALDSDNSEAWAQVAVSRYRSGDAEAALDALGRAANASRWDSYWVGTIAMMNRAFAASSNLDWPARASLALAAYDQPDYAAIQAMCSERAAAGSEWASACLAFGERMEQGHETEFGGSMGRSIQLEVARAVDDADMARGLAQRFESTRGEARGSRYRRVLESMIRADESLFNRYLDAAREYGEVDAGPVFVEQELDRFLGSIGLGHCAPVLRAR